MSKRKYICKNCGREYSGDAKFCAVCGNQLVFQKHEKRKMVYCIIGISLTVILAGMLLIGVFSNRDDFSRMVPDNTLIQNADTQHQTVPAMSDALGNSILDQFVFTGFVPNDTENTDGFWAFASSKTKNVLVGFDKDLNYLCTLDAERYEIYRGPYDGYSYGVDLNNLRNVILDPEARDVTSRYVDVETNSSVLGLFRDETGVTIWACEVTDEAISDGDVVITLSAMDISGNAKNSWIITGLSENVNCDPKFCGGSIYLACDSIFNVATGQAFPLTQTVSSSVDDYSVLGVDNKNNVFLAIQSETETILEKSDCSGVAIWTLRLEQGSTVGRFRDGVCYVHGILVESGSAINGIIDSEGNYTRWGSADTEFGFPPEFRNGYALVGFWNDQGIKHSTLLNKMGQPLFDPIPCIAVPSVFPGHEDMDVFTIVDYPVITDSGMENLNPDGSTTFLFGNGMYLANSVTRCADNYYRIQDGKLFIDTVLKEELAKAAS